MVWSRMEAASFTMEEIRKVSLVLKVYEQENISERTSTKFETVLLFHAP